jgi:hypothetical protein
MKKLLFLLICSTLLVGCGDDDGDSVSSSTGSSVSYIGTISGGSSSLVPSALSISPTTSSTDLGMWSITISSSNTFVVENADGLEVSGTVENLDSGFVKLTVSSSNESEPQAGDIAYGLNVPGVIFFLAPVGDDGEVIPMVKSGTCPSTETSFLWSLAGAKDSDNNKVTKSCNNTDTEGLDIFGEATINSSEITIPSKYDICDNSISGDFTGAFSCTDGVATITSEGAVDAYMYLTEGGGAIVKTQPGDSDEKTIVALAGESSLSISDLEGDYAGVLFIENDEEGDDSTKPVSATITSGVSGKIEVTEWDVENNTLKSGGISGTIHNFESDTPMNGFIKGKLDVDENQSDESIYAFVVCQSDLNANGSGKNIVVCTGQEPKRDSEDNPEQITDPGAGSDNIFSLVLVEK